MIERFSANSDSGDVRRKCNKMKLYVGNLPFSVDDSKLQELFSSYG